ncbi:MAG TPA: peptidase S8 and S53 subtilisin kexin sedolisin, partial [Burkholderiaceae bacterium]
VYTAAASVTGMTTTVTPSTLSLAPGQSASFTVTMAPAASTPKFTWQYGSLTWNDGAGHNVRSPIQVALGQSISAPSDLSATTVSGSRMFTISTGFAGHASANKGMRDVTMGPATTLTPNSNVDAAAVCKATGPTANVAVYNFTVPAGAIVARFALRQADVSGATDDNDVAVVLPSGAVAASEGGTSHETVELLNPAAGNYKVCVASYAAASGSSTHQLSSWIVSPGDTAGGAFNVAMPSTVYSGGTSTVGAVWSGLSAGHRYIGGIQYLDASSAVAAATALSIDTTPGTPLDMPTPIANDKASVTKK